jgi:anthraniloyl-CoA monooxygenase
VKITVIGGGPGGLYFAILVKKSNPDAEIDVYERNAADDTFGWGVVFSEATLGNLLEADEESFRSITRRFATWDAVDVHFKGEVVRSGGHGFCGIERLHLLQVLHDRATGLGVRIHYETEVDDLGQFADSDLVVAADGVNSMIRTRHADEFQPSIEYGAAKFIWLGTTCPFEAFTFWCRENDDGFFTVHAYQYNEEKSTFIVETDEESWHNAGLDEGDADFAVAYFEKLFADKLDGHRLLTNKSEWINFRRVANEHWYTGNLVLLGDAASTAHFSIGSGTKLAMEDAICLDLYLRERDSIPAALASYEEERKWYTDRLQLMARESRRWFETIKRRAHLDPQQFAYSMMTRNKRLGHDKLWLRDEAYIEGVNRWFAERAGVDADPAPPPMFTPFRIGDLEVVNRVVVSPMCMYSAEDGTVDDWHLVHLGSRAIGGAGLVMTEMTDVSPDGRITPGCAGLYKPEHVPAWKRIVDFVHARSKAKVGVQIAHAGRKGATKLMWEGIDRPLPEAEAWPILAPSALKYFPESRAPKAMDRADMDRVKADFVQAAGMAYEAGFDLVEIHMAHGYLLGSFLSPLTNRRDDEYGGGIEARMRYPLEVFEAVRAAWPGPLSVRLSAVDWKDGGQTVEDSIEVARALKERGCAVIDVSTGHTDHDEEPELARCFQVPFAERIRFEAGIPTITVGAISKHGEINAILASGCADLCALARPHLFDPYFTLHAAAEQQYHDQYYPPQYLAAKPEPREKLPWLERERKKRERLF